LFPQSIPEVTSLQYQSNCGTDQQLFVAFWEADELTSKG
jgi:hypothetical protein